MAIILAVSVVTGCRQEVRFTKIPKKAVSTITEDERLTTMFVGVPVDLTAVQAHVAKAVPQNLRKAVVWLDDAACFKRKTYLQCESARVEVHLKRAGRARLVPGGTGLKIEIPFTYLLKARGWGPARRVRETRRGKLVAKVGLTSSLGKRLAPQVTMSRSVEWSQAVLKVMNGTLDVGNLLSGRLRRLLEDTPGALEEELQKAPITASLQKVWKALHKPIRLGIEPALWLLNKPQRVASGGFVMKNGLPVFRIAIGTQMQIQKGGLAPIAGLIKSLPRRGWSYNGQNKTALRVSVKLPYDSVRQALKSAWPDPISTKGDKFTQPMHLKVNDADLFPSGHLVALGLDLDVETPDRAFDLTGKAYLTALPVIDLATKTLVLRNIQLARTYAIPGIGAGTGRRLRLSATPFVEGFKKSVKVNVASVLNERFSSLNALLNRNIGGGLQLYGRFDSYKVARVRPLADGFELQLDFTGDLFVSSGALQAKDQTTVSTTKLQ